MARQRNEGQLSMFGSKNEEVRDRIKRLRLIRGWDQSQLAKKAEMPQPKISQIELGRITPTDDQIIAIAKAFGYTPEFLAAEMNLIPTTRPWLRAYADAGKREADSRTAATTLAAEYVRQLSLKPLPDVIPQFHGKLDDDSDIEEFASDVRHHAQIDDGEVVANAIRAAERLGCLVLPLESELGKHLGMSARADELPVVHVAKFDAPDAPGDRQRWTVAHEIGHLALHGNVAPPQDAREARRMENQAHHFAGAFLCPEDALVETLNGVGGKVILKSLAELKHVWGVSIKALVGRFHNLGYIDADHARSLYKQISARKWNTREPVRVPKESAQWFERSLMRRAEAKDLPAACQRLAPSIGGNASDLLALADWSEGEDAQIVSLAAHRGN